MAVKNIILIFFLAPLFLLAQKKEVDSSIIEVKYYTTFLTDTTQVSSKKEDIMSLRIGQNSSIFRSDLRQKSDSISKSILAEAFTKSSKGVAVTPDLRGVNRPKFTQEVYLTNGKLLVYDKIRRNTFAFEPVNKINWQLINENKKISGYNCKKAVGKYGKRKIIAWYTLDIPFQEGPYTFKGLPGLIISLEDSKQYYTFLLKELKNVKKPIVVMNGAIETTFEKFNAKREEVKTDPVGTFSNLTNYKLSKEEEERIKANNKAKNNHLD